MKRMILATACGLILTLTACNGEKNEIEAVAYGYLNAMGNYRPTDARPFATQQTCDVTLTFYEHLMEKTDSSAYANNMPATITIGDISIDDTTAKAAFHKSTPITQQDDTVRLVKRNGKWLVNDVIVISFNPEKKVSPRKLTREEIASLRKGEGPLPQKEL